MFSLCPVVCPDVQSKLPTCTYLQAGESITHMQQQKHLMTARGLNPLMSTCHYNSAISNNMKLVHWPLMGGLLRLVQPRGNWAGP